MRKIWNLYAYSPNLFNYTFDMWVESQFDSGLGCSLRMMTKRGDLKVEIHNFTNSRCQEDSSKDGLRFVSHPLSFRWLPKGMILNGKTKVLYGYGRQASISFLEYLAKEPPALVHLFVTDGYFSFLLTKVLKRLRTPYILEFPGRDITPTFFRRKIVEGASAIVIYTKEALSRVQQSYSVNKGVVRIIPPGVDLAKFCIKQASSESLFPMLLYIGQISPLKGVLQTVKILKYLKSYFPQATLRIVGRVVDKKFFDEVKTYTKEHSLNDSVSFEDFVSKGKLPEVYSAADLFIFPSKSEGVPQVVLESMACGTPVAALRGTGGHSEIINDGENGILTCSERLGEKVLSVLKDRPKLRQMSVQAPAIAHVYSVDNIYKNLNHLYREILEES